MQIIPVMDILNGIVVHAIRGQRNKYNPLQSNIVHSIDPAEVAFEFEKYGFNQLYVADLDAIITCSTNFSIIKHILDSTKLKLLVDVGLTSVERAQLLLQYGVSKIIIGTETLQRQAFINETIQLFGSDRVVVSIDLKGENVVFGQEFDGSTNPLDLFIELKRNSVTQIIILDLLRVGSCEGVNFGLLRKIKEEFGFNIIVGGGIRNLGDLIELRQFGISGVLVATALHNGAISINDLRQAGFL